VDVQYRAGDICLPASGTFVADSGRSIFSSNTYEQHGQRKNFRWEIPYQCIVRLEEAETFRTVASGPAQPHESPATPQASCKPVPRRPLVLPCFPILNAPRLPDLSLSHPRPPDSENA